MNTFKENKKMVDNILDEYQNMNKITWGYDSYGRWDCGEYDNVPYLEVNNYKIFLCEFCENNGETYLFSIENCCSSEFVKRILDTIIININLCKAYHIDNYEDLLRNLHLNNKKKYFEE